MKRRITLTIALVLSVVLVSLMRSDSAANAAPPQRFKTSTGVVTPAAGQTLRVTVVSAQPSDPTDFDIVFHEFTASGCNGTPAVCRHTINSRGATPVISLGNDAFSLDLPGTGNGVGVTVTSNSRNVRVNAIILDAATGDIIALTPPLNSDKGE